MGDAPTKFFYANATIKYRKNLIIVLEDDTGNPVLDHETKANLIWTAFKERLGVSNFSTTDINLQQFLQVQVDFTPLIQPFSTEEIDAVVKHYHQIRHQGQMVSTLIS